MIQKYIVLVLSISMLTAIANAKSIYTVNVSQILNSGREVSLVKVANESPILLLKKAETEYKACAEHVVGLAQKLELTEENEIQIKEAADLLNAELDKSYAILDPVAENDGDVVVEDEKSSVIVLDFVMLLTTSAAFYELASQGKISPQFFVYEELLKLCASTPKNKISKRDAQKIFPQKIDDFVKTMGDMTTRLKILSDKVRPILEKSKSLNKNAPPISTLSA